MLERRFGRGHGNGGRGVSRDLFRSRLDQIINMKHPLASLGRTVDWNLPGTGVVYTDGSGQPPLPTRLMAGLAILKHTYDLSDEVLCERWVENPYYQFFCGEEFFQHRLVFDRSSLTRWRILADKDTAATTRRPTTSSGSSSPARSEGNAEDQARFAPQSCRRARHRPSQRPSTAWAATTSGSGTATPTTPPSPPPATTSAASSAGPGTYCAKS